MSLKEDMERYKERMLSLSIAGKVSGEDTQHSPADEEYESLIVDGVVYPRCGCDRCKIIRIKRLLSFRFPQSKCVGCGKLHISIYTHCNECRKQ